MNEKPMLIADYENTISRLVLERRELARLVLNMRKAQKAACFEKRSSAALEKYRRLEREVDLAVQECLSEPTLFGDEDEGRLQ
jgi:hypothetical protein